MGDRCEVGKCPILPDQAAATAVFLAATATAELQNGEYYYDQARGAEGEAAGVVVGDGSRHALQHEPRLGRLGCRDCRRSSVINRSIRPWLNRYSLVCWEAVVGALQRHELKVLGEDKIS